MTDTTALKDRPIYWELSATDDADSAIGQLKNLLEDAEKRLGLAPSQNGATLFLQGALHIHIAEDFSLNSINPSSGEGGGMLEAPGEEWKVLLVLFYLRASLLPPFWLCDDKGEAIAPSSWAETQKALKELGVELNEEVLAAALALGLCPAPIEFGESEEIADAWF